MLKLVLPLLFCLVCLGADLFPPETDQRLAREIYKQMVESKSGFSTGAAKWLGFLKRRFHPWDRAI
jgi:hypothetical protein